MHHSVFGGMAPPSFRSSAVSLHTCTYILDGRNCPIAKTAKKSGFRYPTLFPQKTPKRPKSVLRVRNPTPIRLKTPFLVPFWKLVLAHLEDIMGEKGHFQPRSRSFWRFDEKCVRQIDLKLLASVAFPSPRPTFKGNPARTLRGFLFGLVFPVGYRPTFQPESPASIVSR